MLLFPSTHSLQGRQQDPGKKKVRQDCLFLCANPLKASSLTESEHRSPKCPKRLCPHLHSTTFFLITHSTQATPASLRFLEHVTHAAAPGPLHWLFPLSRTHFTLDCHVFTHSASLGLCSNVPFSARASWDTPSDSTYPLSTHQPSFLWIFSRSFFPHTKCLPVVCLLSWIGSSTRTGSFLCSSLLLPSMLVCSGNK